MLSPIKIWRNQHKIAGLIGKTGEIVSWTYIRVPPAEYSSLAPYPVVLVEFTDKQKLMLQMVDYQADDVTFGRKIMTVLRRASEPDADGVILYYVKAKPI
jgi:uncharacterized OB-fold protein